MKLSKNGLVILFLICAAFSFQNCQRSFQAKLANHFSGKASEIEGGGDPYEGKPYVSTDMLCGGSDPFTSRMSVVTLEEIYVTKLDCHILNPPVLIGPTEFTVSQTVDKIYYSEQIFVPEFSIDTVSGPGPALPAPPPSAPPTTSTATVPTATAAAVPLPNQSSTAAALAPPQSALSSVDAEPGPSVVVENHSTPDPSGPEAGTAGTADAAAGSGEGDGNGGTGGGGSDGGSGAGGEGGDGGP